MQKQHTVRFGLDQVDEVINDQDTTRPVYGLGARRFGIAIEDEIIDLPLDKPLTLKDLASAPNSPLFRTTLDRSSENNLIVNPVHHGPITTTRIQTVKRDFATSFSAYSAANTLTNSASASFVSPPETPQVSSSDASQVHVSKRSKPNTLSNLSKSVLVDTPFQSARTRLDFSTDPAALCASTRVPAFLFQCKGVRVKVNNVPMLLAQQYGESTVVTDRAVIQLLRPSKVMTSTDTDAHKILSQLQLQFDPSHTLGVHVPLPTCISKFAFANVADLVPHENRARIILDLLSVLLDTDLHTPSAESSMELNAKRVNTSYRLQRWLTKILADPAERQAQHYLSKNEPLKAICVLMESRQVVKACDLAVRHKMPRLALFLSSAGSDSKSAHAFLDSLNADASPDLVKCVQLASLCLVVTNNNQGLPEWAPQALQGLSLTQALLHVLASMPLMPMVEIVALVMSIEPVLTSTKVDAILLDIMVLVSCKESQGPVKSLIWTLVNQMHENVLEYAVLATILSGLVAHQFDIDHNDFCLLITRTSSELERQGYWDLALKVTQLLGLVHVDRQLASRTLSDLLLQNATCQLNLNDPTTPALLAQDVWVIDQCAVSRSAVVEAKCLHLNTYVASSVSAIPPKPPTVSTFASTVTVPVRMSRRFNTSKLDSSKAREYQHVFELLNMCTDQEPFSSSAYTIALRALRYLVPEQVLAGHFATALNTITMFEKLIRTHSGQQALPGGLGRPAVMDAVLSVHRVLVSSDADAASVAKHLQKLIERRGLDLEQRECGAIRALLLRVNAMVTIQAVPNIMSVSSSPKSTTTASYQSMDLT